MCLLKRFSCTLRTYGRLNTLAAVHCSSDARTAWRVVLTWGNCYEFLRVVTHPRVLRQPCTGGMATVYLAHVLKHDRSNVHRCRECRAPFPWTPPLENDELRRSCAPT